MVRVVVGLAGAILFGSVAIVTFAEDHGFRAKARATVGTVERHSVAEERGEKVYRPVVRYLDQDGRVQTFTASSGVTGEPRLKAGEKVSVLFDPREPGKARLDTTLGRWGLPVACGVASLLFLLFFVRPAPKA